MEIVFWLIVVVIAGLACWAWYSVSKSKPDSQPKLLIPPEERRFHVFYVSRYTQQFEYQGKQWTFNNCGDCTPAAFYSATNEDGVKQEFNPYTFIKPVGIIMLPHSLWQELTIA